MSAFKSAYCRILQKHIYKCFVRCYNLYIWNFMHRLRLRLKSSAGNFHSCCICNISAFPYYGIITVGKLLYLAQNKSEIN